MPEKGIGVGGAEHSEMKLFAHITLNNNIREEQTLREHCIHTAEYASGCLESAGFYHMAYLAGMLHDMGKATKKFQKYMEDAFAGKQVVRGSVNHTFAGVVYLLEQYHEETALPMEKMTAEIISYAIGAHHGLFDCVDLEGKNGFVHRLKKDRKELCYEEARSNYFEQVTEESEIKRLFAEAVKEFEAFFRKLSAEWKDDNGQKNKVFFEIGLLTRLLLSAVIYGDRRDTGEFMDGIGFLAEKPAPWAEERNYLEQKLSQFDAVSEMNQVRSEISMQCLKAAERPMGIYRLNVPTGGGKTLCTLRYALAHAEKYHKKKIIFIIPLLSVLDQNAKVIREYLRDEDFVLEHHSNVITEKEAGEDREELDQYEILTENWGAPVVISTLVQLLNILFTHKTSAIGRMRALCESVIVIDEVQSLPKKTMAMFNMALNFLSRYCNATVVLSSATQPCLEELDWPVRLADMPDLVRLDKSQLAVFERAEIIDRTSKSGMTMEECADFCYSVLQEQDSLLVICNTKSEARNLYEKMQVLAGAEGWRLYHLSTAMCQKHRMEVLEELQERLVSLQEDVRRHVNTQKVVCISTQLVEAGVDFSFESVVRVMAGIDNLAQAAGRCNRSNEYGHKGKVYLINLKDENLRMLKEIADAKHSTRSVLECRKQTDEESLIGEWATQEFYRNLFREKDLKRLMKCPIKDQGLEFLLAYLLADGNPFAKDTEYSYLHQPFKTATTRFQVFDEETIDVFVPYGQGAEILEELREIERQAYFLPPMKEILQKVKGYTVNIFRWQKDKLWEEGLLTGLFEDRMLVLDIRAYDLQYGLNEKADLPAEAYIL